MCWAPNQEQEWQDVDPFRQPFCGKKRNQTWLVVSTILKNMKVSWDDDIPNIWKVIKVMFQTTRNLYLDTARKPVFESPRPAVSTC